MKKVDMSSEAITRRLRQVDGLRELSLSLMKAKKVSDEKAGKSKQANTNSERLTDSEINSHRREAAESLEEMRKMPPMFPNFPKKTKQRKVRSGKLKSEEEK